MDNVEINKYIQEQIMENCWHEWRSMGPGWGYRCGKDCGATSSYSQLPDYCSDHSSRYLLDKVVEKVIEKAGQPNYIRFLCDEVAGTFVVEPWTYLEKLPFATAEQIAKACYNLHKNYASSI